ncbi:MAG TPA: hypothetical protein VJ485_03115 [archaeon]|nr:hypothetical protein [archaeon]
MHKKAKSVARKKLELKQLPEKDKSLLKEIKRIKKLQNGLYREYEIEEDTLED